MSMDSALPAAARELKRSARSRGVTIEAQYTVGEYDILILSAEQSGGLISWLNDNGYDQPESSRDVVLHYARVHMPFVALKLGTFFSSSTRRPPRTAGSPSRWTRPR